MNLSKKFTFAMVKLMLRDIFWHNFFSIELKWQLVNTPSFVMLACVEVFKTSVLQLCFNYADLQWHHLFQVLLHLFLMNESRYH